MKKPTPPANNFAGRLRLTVAVFVVLVAAVNSAFGQTQATVTVNISPANGGTVHPNDGGTMLQIGKTYTLTAFPRQGQVFSNWVGGTTLPYTVLGTRPSYSFVMQSNLVLTANFVTNPFISTKGTYSGLFYDTNGVANLSSGFFTATTTANGGYSGKIQQAGKIFSFSGTFDVTGAASNFVARSTPNPLTVLLQLDLSGGDAVTGQISNGTWTAVLTANRATFNAKTNSAPQAGRYTLFIPGSDNATVPPNGDGFASCTVAPSGNVTFSGTLGDGTKVSQATTLSKDGQWPFYASLYSGKGSVLGWLTFTNSPPTNDLLAFYPFNGDASDASGNANNGQIVGIDSSYGLDRFDRTNGLYLNTGNPTNSLLESYVLVPRSTNLDFNQDFTLSVWVNISNGLPAGHVHNLISDGPDSTGANFRVVSAVDGTNDYLQFVGNPSGGGVDIHAFLAPLRNTWWQAVVVRSGTNLSLFQNGALVTITNASATLLNLPEIWLGGMPLTTNETPNSGEYPLDGGIDDVRMYSRALSALEVQQLYIYESGPRLNRADRDISGLVSWFKLPQPSAKLYPTGFTNGTAVIGSKYSYYSAYAFKNAFPAAVLSFTNGQVWLAGGDLTESLTNRIFFGTNRVTNLSSNRLILTITGASGLFAGSVVNPFTGRPISINGAVLQRQNCGTGLFLGTSQSGRVYFGQ